MASLGELADAEDTSHLISTCIKLQFKPLKDFTIEDLRIMLGQDIGAKDLLPLAIEQLNQNILCEGDLSPGDLLRNVLSLPLSTWLNQPEMAKALYNALKKGKQKIAQYNMEKRVVDKINELNPLLHTIIQRK